MEGREGIAVAGDHESVHGLLRAEISMTEPQEAAKGYQSSPSSPSTSPTPSPPAAAAGHGGDATAIPLAWSLGGEKPSEAAGGNNGMQMAEQSEHANLSSGRRRGRPRGSGRRQILATLGEWYALSAGGSFTPHVIIVGTGEDVAARIMSFSQKGPRSVCILSANGTISNVTLRQPDSSGSTFTYEGLFEILQLMGSFTMAEEGRRRTGGLSVSLAGPDGRVVGGVVAGMLRAASPIQVIVGSFLPNSVKQHQRRMSLQQPSAAPALPAPMVPPPVLTAAMPISQAAPGNGCHAPPASATPQQAHANAYHIATGTNLNTTGFTMVGWPASSQSTAHRTSPDINICLTPQE
ncbi:AT-hook motif nuclear-localized protein 7-like [Phragmites australis]|uniref:AT-hook motif nuclear-localized protein 7-like n=1 Tax=Phragmites australis TaxID=29695 RepID=UPI002D78ECA7|nr:AT-hook motif nuclear-localized protein 7-like [Phragmites australis]